MSRKEMIRKVILSCISLALVLVMIFSGLRILESTVFPSGGSSVDAGPSKTIVRDGVEYFPRQDITVLMVLGIDRDGPVQNNETFNSSGAADMVTLLVFDEQKKETVILHLNRDTMVEMPVLGLGGENAGTDYGQLALAHTYGTGMEDSSLNVQNTLESFLHGMTVDHYLTMHMDAIPILNDAVGGVTVHVVDDFSEVDPAITMGEMTLRGEQALSFVQTRKGVGDQKNTSRMERQKEYVSCFLDALHQKEQEDVGTLIRMYESVQPYIVTDCSAEMLSNLLGRYGDYAVKDIITPEGENVVEDGHYQFHVDEEKLDKLIVDLFYRPKK